MKKIVIFLLITLSTGVYANACFPFININNKITLSDLNRVLKKETAISSNNSISNISTADIGQLINIFLTESKNGQYAVTYNLFKPNNRLRFIGDVNSNNNYSYNFLYTGKLSINGKSLGAYVGKSNWKVFLSGSHMGAEVMEVVAENEAVNDTHVDEMRKAIARSISASLIKDIDMFPYHYYLYKNSKGYILFSYSIGNVLVLNIYAAGNKDTLMEIISNQ